MTQTDTKYWNFFFYKFLITGITFSPVAKGSPGPFDKKIPSGLVFIIE